MVSLFLVEDERIPRDSIKNNVQWREHHINFVGDASDGEIALPKLLECRPDILLTDIKMPFMDGLELSKIVRKKLPKTKIIILSGYNEFDYARQAISLGISEYLLKPVSAADLLNAVEKVRRQIEQERAEETESSMDLAAQREIFFSSLYSGFLSGTQQILERAEQLSISITAAVYRVVMLRLEPSVHRDSKAISISLCSVTDHVKGALPSGFNGEQIVFLLQGEDEPALEENTKALIGWVAALPLLNSLHCEWMKGQLLHRISDIAGSYQAVSLECSRAGNKSSSASLISSTAFNKNTLLEFLRSGKAAAVGPFWETYRSALQSAFSSFIYRGYLYTELFLVIRQFANEIGMNMPASLTQADILERRIAADQSVDDFVAFGCELCVQTIAERDRLNGGRYMPTVEQARAYMMQHYMDAELSLSTVAEAVHLSANHLSTVFKEKLGVGFSEYLTEIRIGQAKHLLVTTDLLASEIGERVGYQNMNYFSMLFKRVVGMAPSHYRREHSV